MLRTKFALFLIGTFLLILTPTPPIFAENPPEGMAAIPGGCFMMGTDRDYTYSVALDPNEREKPAHKVCLDPFYLDTHETTQKQWMELMETNPSIWVEDRFPVEHITWAEADTYCRLRGKRLPTEAEWEYAAKAGSRAENFWGDGINGDYAWYDANSGRKPHPVGTKKPNPWGLYDIMGSVWEWVSDWYSLHYYRNSPVNNPQGPLHRASHHVIKGASWVEDKSFFRAAIRHRGRGDQTETFLVGVRCAQSAGHPDKKTARKN